jgi:hypothetical protein
MMIGTALPAAMVCSGNADVDVPTTRYVCELLVWRATTVLEEPEITVISDPAAKVWPEMT